VWNPTEGAYTRGDFNYRAGNSRSMLSHNKNQEIISLADLNLQKANKLCMASLNRKRKSTLKLKLKRPQPGDIFFGSEIQKEFQRLVNIDQLEKYMRP